VPSKQSFDEVIYSKALTSRSLGKWWNNVDYLFLLGTGGCTWDNWM